MTYSVDTVAVVVDPACGGRLDALVARMPVWVADTPGNAAATERLWDEIRRTRSGSLTRFAVDPRKPPEDWLDAIIEDVGLHHGEHSQRPPYRGIEVHGARLGIDRVDP